MVDWAGVGWLLVGWDVGFGLRLLNLIEQMPSISEVKRGAYAPFNKLQYKQRMRMRM